MPTDPHTKPGPGAAAAAAAAAAVAVAGVFQRRYPFQPGDEGLALGRQPAATDIPGPEYAGPGCGLPGSGPGCGQWATTGGRRRRIRPSSTRPMAAAYSPVGSEAVLRSAQAGPTVLCPSLPLSVCALPHRRGDGAHATRLCSGFVGGTGPRAWLGETAARRAERLAETVTRGRPLGCATALA